MFNSPNPPPKLPEAIFGGFVVLMIIVLSLQLAGLM